MKLIDISVKNGTGVVVGMILVVLFGFLALGRIPIQLSPTIDRPIISIETDYPGAAPAEVEAEVTRRQEERLAAVEDLREMRSVSSEGQSEIILEFDWGVDKSIATLDVNKKLNLVTNLPVDVEEPQISATDSEETKSIIRMTIQSALPVNAVRELLEDQLGPRLERVSGVGRVRWYGGSRREIQVLYDLAALESRRITVTEVIQALGRENQNLRGGKIESGSSRLLIRTVGQYDSLDEVRRTVIRSGPEGPVRIEDIAQVVDGWEDEERIGRTMGVPSVNMSISKKSGANTLEVCGAVRKEVERINEELRERGINFWISYDAADYIWDSIREVRNNLIVGAILATAVLLLFLGSVTSTFAIGIMIPVCTIATFVLMAAFGRSVNVISLAGLAFASGMVVDNGIVVMENIYRHFTEFKSEPFKAARDAAQEVWAPILASTLTTLAVFIPILFIQEEAGQLFRDIAYSISFAVGLSMLAAITIVPMIAARMLRHSAGGAGEMKRRLASRLGFVASFFRALWGGVTSLFLGIVALGNRSKLVRLGVCSAIFAGFLASLLIIPPAEYLPRSQGSFIMGNFSMPSGMSLEGADRVVRRVEDYVLKNVAHLQRVFFVVSREGGFCGIFTEKGKVTNEGVDQIVADVTGHAQKVLPSDVRFNLNRVSDFSWGGFGKGIELDVRGPDLGRLQEISEGVEDQLAAMPEVRGVFTSLAVANPELQVRPDRERLADLGMTARDLAIVVETLFEGARASLYREGGKEFDLVLQARRGQIHTPEELRQVTIKTPSGRDARLDEVAKIERALGPVSIQRKEQERAVELEVNIQDDVPLETFIEKAEAEIVDPLRRSLPPGYSAELTGAADDLRRTFTALSGSFLLALLIIYLLMAALFESFLYPLIIMLAVPISMTGAFIGVRLAGAEFNVITMLGLVLLAGTVVNNAILLVEFAIVAAREGTPIHQAVLDSVRLRIRPIFMTTATTVLGMLPLAAGRGEGTELYRGLGAAVLGGLSLSTVFTLILVPMVLTTTFEIQAWIGKRMPGLGLRGAGREARVEG